MNSSRPALVPEIYVSDFARSLAFYTELVGFQVDYARPESGFASLCLGSAHLMIEETPGFERATAEEFSRGEWRTAALERPFGRGMNLEIQVPSVDAIAQALRAAGHPLLLDPHERSYRVRDRTLTVYQALFADPDGYLIRPSERLRMEVSGSEAGS